MGSGNSSERVLVLAPVAGDGPAITKLLRERGFAAELCRSLTEMCAQIAAGAGALLLTEEALEMAHTPEFFDQLKVQPPWSELPVVILTRGGESRLARLLDLAAEAAGSITGRDDMRDEGRAQQDKAEAERDVARQEAEADKARAEARAKRAQEESHQD